MKVVKFGGTSIGTKENFTRVLDLIKSNERKVVVLSAFSGVTDALINMINLNRNGNFKAARAEIKEFEIRNKNYVAELFSRIEYKSRAVEIVVDYVKLLKVLGEKRLSELEENTILSYGEMISTKILHLALSEQGVSAIWINALEMVRLNESGMPDQDFLVERLQHVLGICANEKIIITQGYICRNHKGEIENLKRGGSDYTATLIGAAVNACEIQIWSDMDGLQNTDPRWVNNTFTIPEITYEAAGKLATYGAKILHPQCILPAMRKNIPIRIKNTFHPEMEGTLICNKINAGRWKAVAALDNLVCIKLIGLKEITQEDFKENIQLIFRQNKCELLMEVIENDITHVLIERDGLSDKLLRNLEEVAKIEIERSQSIICITGIKHNVFKEAMDLFHQLGDFPIRLTYLKKKSSHILLVIDSEYKKELLERLNTILYNMGSLYDLSTIAA